MERRNENVTSLNNVLRRIDKIHRTLLPETFVIKRPDNVIIFAASNYSLPSGVSLTIFAEISILCIYVILAHYY
jgi:hypothetical protein